MPTPNLTKIKKYMCSAIFFRAELHYTKSGKPGGRRDARMKKKKRLKKRKDSISFLFAKYQTVMFLILLLLFFANSISLYLAERQNMVAERSYQLKAAAEKVNTRIENFETSMMEILAAIRNDYKGLWLDGKGEQYFDKQKLNQLIQNKQMLSDGLGFFYVLRTGDFTLFQGRDDAGIYERLSLKDFIEEHAADIVTTTRENSWKFYPVEGNTYLFYCYYYTLADLYIGVAVRPETMFEDLILLAEAYEGSFEVINDEAEWYLYRQDREMTWLGSVTLGEIRLKGTMCLSACFSVEILELLRNNLILSMLAWLLLCLFGMGYMNDLLKKKLIRPIQEMAVSVEHIEDITEKTRILEQAEIYEIHELEKTINTLLQEVVYNRVNIYQKELQEKKQELALLHAQIRLHFFLNAITTVSVMTYQDRNDDIRRYLMKLSDFLRYTINSSEKLVTLEVELEHVKNYSEMQEYRFPGKAMLFEEHTSEIEEIKVPRFLLLTVVENSYKYALGTSEVMQILMQCKRLYEEGFEGVQIVIEDNGPGFREDQLAYYNQPEVPQKPEEQHIGLLNIKQTLALQFGQNDLLRVSNAIPNGARIEIRIPEKTDKGEKNESSDCRR